MKSTIILRIITTGGISRVHISPYSTIGELKNEICTHTQIPAHLQNLYKDQQLTQELMGDLFSISQMGLKHGDVLYVKSSFGATIKGEIIESKEGKKFNLSNLPTPPQEPPKEKVPEKHQVINFDTSDDQSISSSPSNNIPSNNINPQPADANAGFGKSHTSEPHFKSFDQFLAENDYKTIDLPGSKTYQSHKIQLNQMNRLPPTITLKYQPYRHVDHLELMNVNEIISFVNYWRDVCDLTKQRCGWMFGYYREDTHYPLGIRAVLEAIYEPPQLPLDDTVQLLEDPDFDSVNLIANNLGLELIGFVFTHLPRDRFLTSSEVIQIAKFQLKYTTTKHFTHYPMSKFITCTISLDDNSEPFASAFMVSDLGMALVRDGLVDENVSSASHISLRKPEEREILPQILESGKATTEFDADWFLVRVNESAPRTVRSIFSHTHFARENRFTEIPHSCFKDYFDNIPKNLIGKSNTHKYGDFHFLYQIYKIFDLETAFTISNAVINKTPVEEGFEEILRSL